MHRQFTGRRSDFGDIFYEFISISYYYPNLATHLVVDGLFLCDYDIMISTDWLHDLLMEGSDVKDLVFPWTQIYEDIWI